MDAIFIILVMFSESYIREKQFLVSFHLTSGQSVSLSIGLCRAICGKRESGLLKLNLMNFISTVIKFLFDCLFILVGKLADQAIYFACINFFFF